MAKASGVYDRNPQYKKVPDDMYFAGAIRKGQRRYAPDSLGGINSYDSDERLIMDSNVEEGPSTDMAIHDAPGKGEYPADEPQAPELTSTDLGLDATEAQELLVKEAFTPNPITPKQKAKIFAVLSSKGIKGDDQKLVLYGLATQRTGAEVSSTNDISKELAMELIDYMEGASEEELRDRKSVV